MRISFAAASLFALTAALAFALAIASAALAQTNKTPSSEASGRGAATQMFAQYCIASPQMSGRSTPEPGCACAAGVLSGQMTDRQYAIMGRLVRHTDNDAGMTQEVLAMMDEGYSADEIEAVGNLMIAAEPLINSTCAVLER